jgi:hypothetical protein
LPFSVGFQFGSEVRSSAERQVADAEENAVENEDGND